jgi:hypothetical protein
LVLVYKIDDSGGFSGTWRAVKKQVGEIFFLDNVFEYSAINGVQHDFFESFWTVFFDPWNIGL